MYQKFFKRLLDIILSLLAIIITFPIFIIIGLLVLIFLGRPILFKQKRPGKNEEIFTLYKFRTMKNTKDKDGNLLPFESRITKFGKFLRKTSLDEIPEFINILKGDMSFVGPRPLLVEYLDYYKKEEKIRHNVRPGLTGLAQIKGRNMVKWDDRLQMDIDYVKNLSFFLDIKIIIMTIKSVLLRKNIVSAGEINIDGYILKPLNIERKKVKK